MGKFRTEEVGRKEFTILDMFLAMDLAKHETHCKVVYKDGTLKDAILSLGVSENSRKKIFIVKFEDSTPPDSFEYEKYGDEFGVIFQ